MLFIREYTTKSLDRSSVSMVDKYNTRLDKVGELLVNLSSLIENLLSLIRDIRNTLGQCKQRVYDNLNQVKEVIKGNDIAGTEGTISTIEGALKAGDKAIERAEATLQGVKQEINCNERGTPTQPVDVVCGEGCNETPADNDDCTFCTHSNETIICSAGQSFDGSPICSVCNHDGCAVEVSCNEPVHGGGYNPDCDQYYGGASDPNDPESMPKCSVQSIVDPDCHEAYSKDTECSQYNCIHSDGCAQQIPDNCSYDCTHSTDCHESPMPENCTYTCVDNGCSYEGDDCSYGTVCGQEESCNQYACNQYDCGEPCGETCHMTNNEEDCSEEDSEGCGDCGDCGNCGEGDGCGDWSEFCGE